MIFASQAHTGKIATICLLAGLVALTACLPESASRTVPREGAVLTYTVTSTDADHHSATDTLQQRVKAADAADSTATIDIFYLDKTGVQAFALEETVSYVGFFPVANHRKVLLTGVESALGETEDCGDNIRAFLPFGRVKTLSFDCPSQATFNGKTIGTSTLKIRLDDEGVTQAKVAAGTFSVHKIHIASANSDGTRTSDETLLFSDSVGAVIVDDTEMVEVTGGKPHTIRHTHQELTAVGR